MSDKKNEIIIFENQGVKLEVNLKDETVWLTQEQMSRLFEKAKSTINEHIRIYLIVKNHVFADGNKRIVVTLFIYF